MMRHMTIHSHLIQPPVICMNMVIPAGTADAGYANGAAPSGSPTNGCGELRPASALADIALAVPAALLRCVAPSVATGGS
jgi:hypothetical protein